MDYKMSWVQNGEQNVATLTLCVVFDVFPTPVNRNLNGGDRRGGEAVERGG